MGEKGGNLFARAFLVFAGIVGFIASSGLARKKFLHCAPVESAATLRIGLR